MSCVTRRSATPGVQIVSGNPLMERQCSGVAAASGVEVTGLAICDSCDDARARPETIATRQMTRAMSSGIEQPGGTIEAEPTIDVQDVARAVVYMASLPLSANVQFMTVMATKMPFIGRG